MDVFDAEEIGICKLLFAHESSRIREAAGEIKTQKVRFEAEHV